MGEKAIFIMSLHEDGSLLITTPSKIAKNYCENEIKEIKDKKLKNELMRKPGNEEQGESDKVEKLRNIIKETINIKSIKSVFEKVSPPLYSFVEHS